MKNTFKQISKNPQENTCAELPFLIKLQTLFKKRFQHGCFLLNFYEIFKNTNFEEHLLVVASEVSVSFICNSLTI